MPAIVYYPVMLLYCLGVLLLTEKSLTKSQCKKALMLLYKESREQRIMGNIVAVLLVLSAPILFMCILWVLARLKYQ